ncbi:hypothetical protein [Roseomonas rosulenta]|uniref:hypothetical protein n=1 Tax=Roseomonas rosulenta TaxID=2748667 RepID=UPI0018DF637E|nr:hypothetical protein [Roseomonas rosulenta]
MSPHGGPAPPLIGLPSRGLDLASLNEQRLIMYGGLIMACYPIALGLVDTAEPAWRSDFMAFYSASRMALGGDGAGAYDWPRLQLLQAEILQVPAEAVAPVLGWVNPPYFSFFELAFALLSYVGGWVTWILATGTLFGLAARSVLRAAGLAAAICRAGDAPGAVHPRHRQERAADRCPAGLDPRADGSPAGRRVPGAPS